MKRVWVGALLVCGALLPIAAAGADASTTLVQGEAVPTLCQSTGARIPTLRSSSTVVSAPATINTGHVLALRGLTIPGISVTHGGTLSATFAVSQDGVESLFTVPSVGPVDRDVTVTAVAGTLVEVRLVSFNLSQPIPDLGLTFAMSCERQGSGVFARWVVGGGDCASGAGYGDYRPGISSGVEQPQRLSLHVHVTGCTIPEATEFRLAASFGGILGTACGDPLFSQGPPVAGVAGRGRIVWPNGAVSHLSVIVAGSGSPHFVSIRASIIDGPRGGSVALDLVLIPRRSCPTDTERGFTILSRGRIVV